MYITSISKSYLLRCDIKTRPEPPLQTCFQPYFSVYSSRSIRLLYSSSTKFVLNECRSQTLRSYFTLFFNFQAINLLIAFENFLFLFWFCIFLNNMIFPLIHDCLLNCPESSSSVLHKMSQNSFIHFISLVSVLLTGSCHIMSAWEKFQTAKLCGNKPLIFYKPFAWQSQHLTNRQKSPQIPAAPQCFNSTSLLKHMWHQPEQR